MKTHEKFEAFKEKLISENEKAYGKEARAKYGDEAVDGSNELLKQMGEEKYTEMQSLGEEINALLKDALINNYSAESEKGKEIAEKHKNWLSYTWKKYSPEAHKGLADGYIADERFTRYYDDACGNGAAQLLRDTIFAHV